MSRRQIKEQLLFCYFHRFKDLVNHYLFLSVVFLLFHKVKQKFHYFLGYMEQFYIPVPAKYEYAENVS